MASRYIPKRHREPKVTPATTGQAPNSTQESVMLGSVVDEALQSGGRQMDRETQEFMESRFHHDFSHVRVHTDDKAGRSADALAATAYTRGTDIVFAKGQYNPTSGSGRQLIAHELTHVVQQSTGPVNSSFEIDGVPIASATGSLEQTAARNAYEALQSREVNTSTSSSQNRTVQHQPGSRVIQRNPVVAAAAVTEPIEVIAALASVAALSGQVYSGGSGKLAYSSTTADRLAEGGKTQPKSHSWRADCLHIAMPAGPNAVFTIKWEGNNFGEIGAATVRVDIDRTDEFIFSDLNVRFESLRNLIQPGADKRTWEMVWDYEGTFDPVGVGEFWFQGRFAIDAFGNFKPKHHRVRDLSLGTSLGEPDWKKWGEFHPYRVVAIGPFVAREIPPVPVMALPDAPPNNP